MFADLLFNFQFFLASMNFIKDFDKSLLQRF